jgi:hypothetical protein
MRPLLLASLWAAAMSMAAAPASGQTPFTVKAGFTASTISVSGRGAFDTSPEIAPAVGGSVAVAIRPTVRFQPEVWFALRRFTSSDFPLPLAAESRSLEVPLLMVKVLRAAGRTHPMLFGGPQLSYLITVKQTVGSQQSDITNDFDAVDGGITFGGGLEIDAARGALVIEARANVGLRDLSKVPETSVRSRAFFGLLGYRF